MAEQPELDLPTPPAPPPAGPARRPKMLFAGFTRSQVMLGAALLVALIWGMWVTREVVRPKQESIVAARLSALVGDYVDAQRYSGSPPERVKAEMQAFMASLDKELERRGADGQVILVGEAVLSKNVPDITDSLRKAVIARGVPEPRRASVEQLQALQAAEQFRSADAPPLQGPVAPAGMIDPVTAGPMSPQGAPRQLSPAMGASDGQAGATVSTFGGPGGDGGQ